jgi:hypothetical protein
MSIGAGWKSIADEIKWNILASAERGKRDNQ